MHHVGVLAYGSLLTCPGAELEEATVGRRRDVLTPFPVEFARCSTGRGGAPTLVPVTTGGARVKATILVMHDWVTLEEARDRLYRREIGQVNSDRTYEHRENPGPNQVRIVELSDLAGVATVVYTALADTIPVHERAGELLADLAIRSVAKASPRKDGITYLADALKEGITTPLSREYEVAVLRKTGASTLNAALDAVESDP